MSPKVLVVGLAFIAFIALGLPDALLGIAWPFMRIDIKEPLEASGIIVMAGTMGAALSGLLSSWLGRRLGIGRLLALSCLMTGLALVGYSMFSNLWFIVGCAIVVGLAAGATDATVNGYVAKHFSERMMQWLHASFGVGVTIGPVVMTWILIKDSPWQLGYQFHAGLQIVLAVLFLITASLWLAVYKTESGEDAEKHVSDHHETPMVQSLKDVRVWLGMAIFFFYCGAEYSVGLWTFSLLTEMRGVSAGQAGIWVSVYWGMFTVGRIVMGFVANKFSSAQMINFGFVLSAIGALIFALSDNVYANLFALVAIGFAYAPVYPAVVSTTLKRVGAAHFSNAMGLQVTGASLGIALLPGAIGLIASRSSLAVYPWLLLLLTALMAIAFVASMNNKHDGSEAES
jgi:fucose permease